MDRRQIELQLRVITVTYRVEQRRRDSRTMEEFRERGRTLLRSLEDEVRPHPDLQLAWSEALRKLDAEQAAFDISKNSDLRGDPHPRPGVPEPQ